MYSQQLRVLLKRNLLLKKRSPFFTLLEITIPILLLLFIINISSNTNRQIEIRKGNKSPMKRIGEDISQKQIDLNFVFPSSFDSGNQERFLKYIKNDEILNGYTFIDESKEFSEINDDSYYSHHQNRTNSITDDQKIKNTDKTSIVDKQTINNTNKTTVIVENYENGDNKYTISNKINNLNSNSDSDVKEIRIKVYKTESDMLKDYNVNSEKYQSRISFYAVVFKTLTEYTLHFVYDDELMDSLKNLEGNCGNIKNADIIQLIVNKAILKTYSSEELYYKFNSQVMENEAYKISIKEYILHEESVYFLVFSFIPCICSLLNNLVIEKESKFKESLVIIGLKRSVFWFAWAIIYLIIVLLNSGLVLLVISLYGYYNYIHGSIIFISMFLFGISCCCGGFLLSSFIKKSRTASIFTIVVILAFFGAIGASYCLDYYNGSNSIKIFLSYIFSPISFMTLFNFLLNFEKQGISIDIINFFKFSFIRKTFLGLVFTIFLYLILAIYLDNVLPQGDNLRREWNFFINDFKEYVHRKRHPEEYNKKNNFYRLNNYDTPLRSSKRAPKENPYIQDDPKNLVMAVEVKNISKTYNTKGEINEVLKKISFNAYYDEIFAILGQNGAGKTTLISIMTGILASTSGEICYDGKKIKGNETEICKKFGYCPQFDTFSNNLTVAEHIRLYAGIKNITVNVDEYLKEIDLLKKKNNYPEELSGGQRRKLCIALAFLGSPKFVFLDEPTTGLDPFSRKHIWDYLSKKKSDRVIFITTHYMDEADLLADRKMITSNGIISCLGTSLFLKSSFNMNYSLDIIIEKEADSSLTDDVINHYCPEATQSKVFSYSNSILHKDYEMDNGVRKETTKGDLIVTYLISFKYAKLFKDILKGMNALVKDESNTIKNFSLTSPTLEELFIKLENNDAISKAINKIKNTAVITMDNVENNEDGGDGGEDDSGSNNNKSIQKKRKDKDNSDLEKKLSLIFNQERDRKNSWKDQILSLIVARLKIFSRNKTFAIFYILLPVCITVISVIVGKLVNESDPNAPRVKEYSSLKIIPEIYGNLKWFKDSDDYRNEEIKIIISEIEEKVGKLKEFDPDDILNKKNNFIGGFGGYVNDDYEDDLFIYQDKAYCFINSIGINLYSNGILNNRYEVNKVMTVYYKPFTSYPRDVNKDDEKHQEGKDVFKDFQYTNEIINYDYEENKSYIELYTILTIAITLSLSIATYGPISVKEREEGITHLLCLNGMKKLYYWIAIFISDSVCILVPLIPVIIAGMISGMTVFNIKVVFYTLFCILIWDVTTLFHQYFYSSLFKNYEKNSNLFIILNPVCSLIVGFIILVYVIDNDSFRDDSDSILSIFGKIMGTGSFKLYHIIIALVFYSPATLIYSLAKITSYIYYKKMDFTKEDLIEFLSSKDGTSITSKTNMSIYDKKQLITKTFLNQRSPSMFDLLFKAKGHDNFLLVTLLLLLLMVFYCYFHYLFEKVRGKTIRREIPYRDNEREKFDKERREGPVDVRNEWERVGRAVENNDNSIAIKGYQLIKDFPLNTKDNLKEDCEEYNRKIFNKKKNKTEKDGKSAFEKMDNRIVYDESFQTYINRIVNDVTIGVNSGECLGLLGPNGAGKTTTISMMVGTLNHTHGVIVYGNNSLAETEYKDLSLGYCAQHNILWNLLTVRETISFYLSIAGYPKEKIEEYTQILIEACGIENFANKKVSNISGGTKRKLSLIVSIASSPSYLILDEPSSGMDPFTRRYMWKLIDLVKHVRQTATILTTHSTEEAEALCERIAILVKGSLMCIDTIKSIKMNHNDNYILEVFTDEPELFEEEYIKNKNIFGIDFESLNAEDATSPSSNKEKGEDVGEGEDEGEGEEIENKNKGYELETNMNYQKYTVKMKTENIANVFAMMEEAKERRFVDQYNFGQYSLEQVFINFINDAE